MTELDEYLTSLREDVATRVEDDKQTIYPELAYMEMAFEHMGDVGIASDGPELCFHEYSIRNAKRRISGFAISEDGDSLDLFISVYKDSETVVNISEKELKDAATQCQRVLMDCADGSIVKSIDPASPFAPVVQVIKDCYEKLDDVRIFVITDGKTKAKSFKPIQKGGKLIRLEVLDIERLHRHQISGKPSDDIEVNFEEGGHPLTCVTSRGEGAKYDYVLSVIPGQMLFDLYYKFGPQLLEANVRSFLSVKAKGTNKGIETTLRFSPEKFMAYNNGLVMTVNDVRFGKSEQGETVITWVKGLQIVNGGQTAATIFFSKRKYKDIDLSKVSMAVKIIILRDESSDREASLVTDISRYSNTQNAVKQSDFSSNRPFHVHLQRTANSLYCPDGVSKWFYERSSGSYATMLALKGTTKSKLQDLKKSIPPSRKLTKQLVGKLMMGWEKRPEIVTLGNEKCYKHFIENIEEQEKQPGYKSPDEVFFKRLIGMHLIYKYANKVSKPAFKQSPMAIANYTYSLVAKKCSDAIDFDYIWQRQKLSEKFKCQIEAWVHDVGIFINTSADGRQISEWAKGKKLIEEFNSHEFEEPDESIPEISKH